MPPPPGGNAAGAQGQPGSPAGQPGSWQPGNRAGNSRATAGQRPPANKPTPARQRPLTIRYAGGQCRRRQEARGGAMPPAPGPAGPASRAGQQANARQPTPVDDEARGGRGLAAAEELAGSGCG